MAGRILKITLENSHPPIWRRIMIPDHINFQDLHKIIQILFDWGDYHLHCFENSKYDFLVEAAEDPNPYSDLTENQLLVDDYIEHLPWIRYTYDFGDNWCLKIVLEKTDPTYTERHATILKYKGASPEEDSGGIYSPYISFTAFDPVRAENNLEALKIPNRETKSPKKSKSKPAKNPVDALFSAIFDRMRAEHPELNCLSDEQMTEMLAEILAEPPQDLESGQIGLHGSDQDLDSQLRLLDTGKTMPVVLSKHSLTDHLSLVDDHTIADYLKYSCLACDNSDQVKNRHCLAEYFLSGPEVLYNFFYREELKDLIRFRDSFLSGKNVWQGQPLEAICKAVVLGLIRITGKKKHKMELCAEFSQIIDLVDRNHLDEIYRRLEDHTTTIGTILMAYTSLSFDNFYRIYCEHSKNPFDRETFERFIYWSGTMNQGLNTSFNHVTGERYLSLPETKKYFSHISPEKFSKLYQAEPRPLTEIEFATWKKGIGFAIPEWNEYYEILRENLDFPSGNKKDPLMPKEGYEDFLDRMFIDFYIKVVSAATLTDLILNDLKNSQFRQSSSDDEDALNQESWLWHQYAVLCLATPILGLNGYTRESYAEKFHVPLDYIPLFDRSVVKNRVTKNTRIYELPESIQLEMMEALRKGSEEYEKVIQRLCRQYKSNKALAMENAEIMSAKIPKQNPDFENTMNDQKILYPWSDSLPELPVPETYVRETKKIGRNDPCPCGSGRKYKHCCGKNK